MTTEPADYLDYEITDVESYASVLRGTAVEISQLEPGPLRGHHLRVVVPSGEISWIVTNLPLRGRGHFPSGVWTLSVVARAASHSLQHGTDVHTGSLLFHRPGAQHDGIYGRDFSVVCLCVRSELFPEILTSQFPELSDVLSQPWAVHEPGEERRQELIVQFEQAAAILRADESVRESLAAKAVMQDELLGAYLEALTEATMAPLKPGTSQAVALVRRAEELAGDLGNKMGGRPLCVGDLCVACGAPRRTLNYAFQQVLGMGPVTYLRRLRLNQVRRSLRRHGDGDLRIGVTEMALDHGFWHLGRFSSQYRELFGESPHASVRSKGNRKVGSGLLD